MIVFIVGVVILCLVLNLLQLWWLRELSMDVDMCYRELKAMENRLEWCLSREQR
jgi:hypothetical protein